jgi:hypothetical protein
MKLGYWPFNWDSTRAGDLTSGTCAFIPSCTEPRAFRRGSFCCGLSRHPLLLAANVHPKIVQECLGHATIAMTMDLIRT